MKAVFADTFYFFALLSDKDESHAKPALHNKLSKTVTYCASR